MKVELVDDSKELRKAASEKFFEAGACIFLDIQYEYMFLSYFEGKEVKSIATKLMDKSSNISISEIGKLISTITLIFKSNPVLISYDIKNTIKNYLKLCKACCHDSIEHLNPLHTFFNNNFVLDTKIFKGVYDSPIHEYEQISNYCDFETYVKSRAEILKKIIMSSSNISLYRTTFNEKSSYYINLNAINAILSMEDKTIEFLDTNNEVIKTIEPYFNLNGTYTGRTTSNTHAIPKDKRGTIKLDKDNKLYCFDYEAGEVRVLAILSGDKKLIKIFEDDKDIYEEYMTLFGEDAIDRKTAKLTFLSIMNGVTIKGLEKTFKMSNEVAKEAIKNAKKLAPKAFQFLDYIREEAVNEKAGNGQVFINEIFKRQFNASNRQFKNDWERKTAIVSFYLQSTLSDIKLIAISKIKKILDTFNENYRGQKHAYLRFEIHDAVYIEIPTDNLGEVILNKLMKEITQAMEIAPVELMGEEKCKLKINITKVG